MTRWIVPFLLFLATAVGAWHATLAVTTFGLMEGAVRRLSARAGLNTMFHGQLATPANQPIVRPSPDLAYSSCPYDLSEGALLINYVPVAGRYSSLSVFDARTDVVFVRNDVQAGGKPFRIAIARELGKAYPELGDEFALTAIELGFLTERRMAFENLSNRVPLDAVRGVVTTMIQTEKYGTPLASALRVLSAEFRNERMMRAEEKAARLPAIMTVPLILFILPVLFVVILGPAACSIADAFSHDGPAKGGG